MSIFLEELKNETNYIYTENGALTHKTTNSALLDMFAMGAAMRKRTDSDIILMFRKAFEEDPKYAIRCLFYIRDVRGGQGERRFFRVIIKDIANNAPELMTKYYHLIPEYGRWDDLYCFINTPIEEKVFDFMKSQFSLDMGCKTPSLLGKWLKSENASSKETKLLGMITRNYFGLNSKQYRVALSSLRKKINIVERLMSLGEWDKIEFDKIPSKAGFIYRNAFARRDIIGEKYRIFANNKKTTVNAGTLYPYEVVGKAINLYSNNTERLMVNKYWDNLTDYFGEASLNALAMVDTSGSMCGTPIDVAISLGLYCAERCKGPFANHYISFSSRPQLIACEGIDFVDKVNRIYRTNLCENTNIEAAFDLLLETAIKHKVFQEDLPKTIIVISDMEFDAAQRSYPWYDQQTSTIHKTTLMEDIKEKWILNGYKMPNLIYWNVDARQDNISMKVENGISFVSGFSPSIFDSIIKEKTAFDLMFDKLDSKRYDIN